MIKNIRLLITSLAVITMMACSALPFTEIKPSPAAPDAVLPIQTISPEATQAMPLPTAAPSLPNPTATDVLASPTPISTPTQQPGPAITLSQLHMLDGKNGWAWSPYPQNDGTYRLVRTTDGGQTWLDGSPKANSSAYYGGFFLNDQMAWVPFNDPTGATSGGYVFTTDGGKTWQTMPANDKIQNASLTFSTAKDGIAEIDGVGAGNLYINYFETHDAGATWQPILLTAPNPEPGLQPGTVHLCNICGDGLYYSPAFQIITYGSLANDPVGVISLDRSTDLGKHWKRIALPLPDKKYGKVMAGPQIPFFFGQQGILPVHIMQYKADGSLSLSVLAIYTSNDGGQTWTSLPGVLQNAGSNPSVQMVSSQAGFVRCGADLCATTDGGQTWKPLPKSLDFDSSTGGPDYVFQFGFTSPTNGWAISGQDPATTVWLTSDGGMTWNKLAPTLVQP